MMPPPPLPSEVYQHRVRALELALQHDKPGTESDCQIILTARRFLDFLETGAVPALADPVKPDAQT